jgi:hypothetical protein
VLFLIAVPTTLHKRMHYRVYHSAPPKVPGHRLFPLRKIRYTPLRNWVRWSAAGVATPLSDPGTTSECVPGSAVVNSAAPGHGRVEHVSPAGRRSIPGGASMLASARPSATSGPSAMWRTKGTLSPSASWSPMTCANSKRHGDGRRRPTRRAMRTRPKRIGCVTRCDALMPSSIGGTIGAVSTAARASLCAGARGTAQRGVA